MHERDDTRPSTFHPSNTPLPKDKWEERVFKEKEKERKKTKEDVVKEKEGHQRTSSSLTLNLLLI